MLDADGTPSVAPEDRLTGRRVACVDISPERSHAWITVAGNRADGQPQVEVIAKRAGVDWVAGWFSEVDPRNGSGQPNHAYHQIDQLTGQAKGAPISPLITALEADESFPVEIVPLAGSELLDAWAWTFDAVKDGTVRHHLQPPLDRAAALARTNTLSAGARLLDRRTSSVDISPLQAFVGALWLLLRRKPNLPPPPPPPQALTVADAADDTSDLADLAF